MITFCHMKQLTPLSKVDNLNSFNSFQLNKFFISYLQMNFLYHTTKMIALFSFETLIKAAF